ncbi:hypothetical protein [Peptoniphilus rhinitidis]|uniref:hypothetical protein n=1 Tax=Peptoniphilus rhinitidis TaxID=1175452 RepID=UPI000287B7D3|nr:hypothetical protein [Peptoniphilus rhinitidis]
MNSKYKNPYKKNYKLQIIDKINRNGINYGKIEDVPFFLGNEKVCGDEVKINGKPIEFLSGNRSYIKLLEDKDSIELEINWKNRLLLMQENLGNALVRHFLNANTNFKILNYKVNRNSSYIDIEAKDFKFMTVKNLESLVNYAVFSNLEITNYEDHISIERLANIEYFGPSLKRTGEIGIVLITSVDKINSAIRLNISSGENGYKIARNSLNLLNNIKMYLNSDSIEDAFSDIKKLKSKNLSRENNFAKDKNLEKTQKVEALEKLPKTEKLPKLEKVFEKGKNNTDSKENEIPTIKDFKNIKNNNSPEKSPLFYQVVESFKRYATEVSGINYIYKILKDVNLKELREISNHILKEENYIQIYGLQNGGRSKILILRSQNLNFDLKKIFKKLKEHFEFTGTGNMFTLELECKEKDITRIMESFLIEIKREV